MTEEQFRTEIGEDWIKTADVTCQNLKVSKLATLNSSNASSSNCILAEGKYFTVLNGYGDSAVTITSNDVIDFGLSDGNIEIASDSDSEDYISVAVSSGYTPAYTTAYRNTSDIVVDVGEITIPEPIGNQQAESDINVSFGIRISNISSTTNSNSFNNGILTPTGSIESASGGTQSGNYTIYFSASWLSQNMYIKLYKKNADGTYESTETESNYMKTGFKVGKTWPATSSSSSTGTFNYYYGDLYINNVSVPGTYKIQIGIPATSLYFDQQYTNLYMSCFYTTRSTTSYNDFIYIGSNGLIINNNNCVFIINEDGGLQMKSGTKSKFYGIKVTPSGMYYSNGSSTWSTWVP